MIARHRRTGSAVSGTVTYTIECDLCPTGVVSNRHGDPAQFVSAQDTARAMAQHQCHGHQDNCRYGHNEEPT